MPLNAAQLKFCAMEMQHKQGRHLSKLKPDGVPSANISPAPKMGKQNPRQMLHPHLAGCSFPPSTTTITNEKRNREIDDVVSLSLSPFLSPSPYLSLAPSSPSHSPYLALSSSPSTSPFPLLPLVLFNSFLLPLPLSLSLNHRYDLPLRNPIENSGTVVKSWHVGPSTDEQTNK